MLSTVSNLKDLTDKIDIVSCSIGFKSGPGIFNIRDDLYYAIRNLTSSGTIWVNSAGNEAEKHWMGKFNDPDGDGFNNFRGKDKSINITLEKGTLLSVILVWNDWQDPNYGYSTQDYDLWVLGPKPEDTKYSKRPQKGHRNEFPQEIIGNMIAPRDGIYQILIEKKNATTNNTMFHIFVDSENNRIGLDEYSVSQSSLNAVACYDIVKSVGALNTSNHEIKPYSSRGPPFSGRLKPDLVAPTDLQTVSYYPSPFTGTSAAAPVVAGCIALDLSEDNLNKNALNSNNLISNNRDQIDNSKDVFIELESHATDLGPKGPDNIYGYGLINMSFLSK
jgi:subtilisin family serine protease